MMRRIAPVIVAMFLSACGSKSPTGPSTNNPGGGGGGGNSTGTLTATIDGVSFSATGGLSATLNNGLLSIAGVSGTQSLSFAVAANRGTGTYVTSALDPLGLNATFAITPSGASWQAFGSTGTATLTITTLTSTNAAGTFAFALAATPGTAASGTKTVANGVFNAPVTAPPTGTGTVNGTITARVDGVTWSGTSSATAQGGSGFFSIQGTSADGRNIAIAVIGSAPGTYSLTFGNPHNASMTIGGQIWLTAVPGGAGSVTVTEINATRVVGTFTMTMQPSMANTNPQPAQVTDGAFNLAF
jgi:hypothetical protein